MYYKMENKEPTLSICIPIYNRIFYLEKMLARFLEDRDLFEEKIELIISDNHSKEELQPVVENFEAQGLKLRYYRQVSNLGSDGNFLFCFSKATGKYCWLLGSDDIPVQGFLKYLIRQLDNDNEYGLIYLRQDVRNKLYNRVKSDEIYSEIVSNNQKMISEISVWITFMSSSIIRTKFVRTIDLKKYSGTSLIQVPSYVKSCLLSEKNLLVNYNYCFEPDNDNASSGGYNFYEVFVENLFSIMQGFVDEGLYSKKWFEKFKKIEYDYFLISNTKAIFIDKIDKIHKVDGAYRILWKYYGRKPYAYIDLVKYFCLRLIGKIIGK